MSSVSGPREGRDAAGLRTGERGQVAVVHHGPHRDPESGPEEEDPQTDGQRDRHHHGDEAVPGEDDVTDVEAAVLEQRRERVAVVLVPDHPGQPDEGEHDAHRHHELGDERRTGQVAHDRTFERDAEQRRSHEHDERESDPGGPVPARGRTRELPVDVGEEHPDRTLGEVEDPGGRVDDHQTARRECVDARHGQGEDEQVEHRGAVDRIPGPAHDAHADEERDGERQYHDVRPPPAHRPRTPSLRLADRRISR